MLLYIFITPATHPKRANIIVKTILLPKIISSTSPNPIPTITAPINSVPNTKALANSLLFVKGSLFFIAPFLSLNDAILCSSAFMSSGILFSDVYNSLQPNAHRDNFASLNSVAYHRLFHYHQHR